MVELAAPVPERHDCESGSTADDTLDIRVWLRLLTCTNMIERELRGVLASRFASTLPRFDALAQLDRAPDGLSMGQLSGRMMVSNGNVTGVVDRLASDGMVERIPSASDRRITVVRLTDAGRALFARMTAEHHRRLHRLLSAVARDDLERLLALLRELKASVQSGANGG